MTSSPSIIDNAVPLRRPFGPGRTRGQRIGIGSLLVLYGASALSCIAIVFVPMPRVQVGVLVLLASVLMMVAGIHIAVSMALPALIGVIRLAGPTAFEFALESIPRSVAASWTLSVIPMFVMMGYVLFQTGIATTIFETAKQWIGRVPGALGVATILTGAGISSASGSTLGVTYATSRIAIPEMLRAGYSPSVATGTVTVAGVLKMLIPPSITVVIYSGIAGTPVGPQLVAGLIPGLILAVLFVGVIVVRAKINPAVAPPIDTSRYTWGSRFISLGRAWPVVLLAVIIVGGIYSGIATATEAGALAAFAALVIGAWMTRKQGFRSFITIAWTAVLRSVGAVASILFLIAGVTLLTLAMSLSGLVQQASQFAIGLGLDRVTFLLLLVVMYVVMGMFMDELAMMLLTVPILIPILDAYDIDLIWFGVFLILLCEIGMVVPPVGLLSFVVHGIAQDPEINGGRRITLVDVFRGVFWYVLVAVAFVVVLIYLPDLALWLPNAVTVK